MAVADYVSQATLLDDFNRSNTGPPPSASWNSGSLTTGTSQLQVVSNQLKRGGAGFGSCVWGSTLGPDTIVVLTVATVGDFAIDVRAKEINAATYDSYELNYTSSTHTFEIIRILNNGSTSLVSTTSVTLTNGDKVAFLALGTTLAAAVYQSGAWSADILSTTDSNYALAGYVGIWANGTTPVFDDFSAATVTAATKQQAYPRRDSMRLNALLRR